MNNIAVLINNLQTELMSSREGAFVFIVDMDSRDDRVLMKDLTDRMKAHQTVGGTVTFRHMLELCQEVLDEEK